MRFCIKTKKSAFARIFYVYLLTKKLQIWENLKTEHFQQT